MKNSILIVVITTSLSAFSQNEINWSEQFDIAPSTFGNNFPKIVKGDQGFPVVIWNESTKVNVAKYNGVDFDAPIQMNPFGVTTAGASWMGPDIASKDNFVYVVYKEAPETVSTSHIWCVKSTDGGTTFGTPVQVEDISDSLSRFCTVTIDDLGNPIVAFMKFASNESDPQWVVVRSTDQGATFSEDVLASAWSDATAEACDCCPGQIISDANKVLMLYRDNNSNIRDTWVGVSSDGGASFTDGYNIDSQGWPVSSCPASGPDGIIVGDTLYSVFMNGVSGTRVYYNKTSISNPGFVPQSLPINNVVTGLSQQNFPRVDADGSSVAFAFTQVSAGSQKLIVQYTSNIANGININQEIVDIAYVGHPDLVIIDDKIFVLWEDLATNTVKCRIGTKSSSGVSEQNVFGYVNISPNPSSDFWTISGLENFDSNINIELVTATGQIVHQQSIKNESKLLDIQVNALKLDQGIYFLKISDNYSLKSWKLIKN